MQRRLLQSVSDEIEEADQSVVKIYVSNMDNVDDDTITENIVNSQLN
jgi:hypothetical protein